MAVNALDKVPFQISGGFNVLPDYTDVQNTVNMYVQQNQLPDGTVSMSMLPFPGMKPLKELLASGKGRAMYVFDQMYVVISQFVYRVDSALNYSVIGTLSTTSGYVGIQANNGNQIEFNDGVNGWVWNTSTNTWSQITSDGFVAAPSSVAFMEGFMICPNGDGSNKWQVSDPNDATTWDPTQFVLFESKPDQLVAIATLQTMIFVMGTKYIEIWYLPPGGSPIFPFVNDTNMQYETGCAAIGSIAQDFDVLVWLGQTKEGKFSVMMSNGGPPFRISTDAVDKVLSTFASEDIADASAYMYTNNGHTFYCINFTGGNTSFVFDFTTQMWFTQAMEDGSRHIAQAHAYFNNTHYALSYKDGVLYELDPSYNMNGTESITRKRVTQMYYNPAYRKRRVNELQLTLLQGQGTANGVNQTPRVELRVSRDGGVTFGKPHTIEIGKIGQFLKDCIFRNLGVAKRFVFDIRCYNAINFVLMGAAINFDDIGD